MKTEKKDSTPPPAPAPVFDPKKAVGVSPRRHGATARTVGFVQAEGEEAHLFSATGGFVATVKGKEAAAFLPPPPPATAFAAPAA